MGKALILESSVYSIMSMVSSIYYEPRLIRFQPASQSVEELHCVEVEIGPGSAEVDRNYLAQRTLPVALLVFYSLGKYPLTASYILNSHAPAVGISRDPRPAILVPPSYPPKQCTAASRVCLSNSTSP